MRHLVNLVMVLSLWASSPARANDGCTETQTPGCGGCACEACVCAADAYCCETAWDSLCVGACQDQCGGCGGGTNPGGCGAITYEGCCQGQVIKWCENGQLMETDCTSQPSCGWNAAGSIYDCGTAGTGDPSGLHPMSCSGGTSPVCGNGVCESGETATSCPADCGGGGSCGNVSFEGCCEGQILKFCDSGQLKTIDCSGQPYCGWHTEGNFYDCGTAGTGDPSGMNPLACGGGTSPVCGNGVCEGGETAASCPGDCGSCNPSCVGKECGDDGCGGSCGTCPAPGWCDFNGQCQGDCTPDCLGKACGDDGCGGSCGACGDEEYCNAGGQCLPQSGCVPDCAGRVCGDDGCGGSCGTCAQGEVCALTGQCLPEGSCMPDCADRVCGDDGCGGSCWVAEGPECGEGNVCNELGLCVEAPGEGSYYTNPCEEGYSLIYGKCLPVGEEPSTSSGGCSPGFPVSSLWWVLLLLPLLRRRR